MTLGGGEGAKIRGPTIDQKGASMAIPDGYTQMNLYIPDEMLEAVDEAAHEATGRKNGRSDWVRAAIAERLGADRDKRLIAIETAFGSMNEKGRDALAEFADMAGGYKPYRG